MHKSERLFQLVNHLKGRKVAVTAKQLAERLAVSERTIYRDIQNLQTSGVPVEGEAGIGYLIRDYDLPPMMFSPQELQALLIGSQMIKAWTDPQLSQHAQSAIAKIDAVLPPHLKQLNDNLPFLAVGYAHGEKDQNHSQIIRLAIESRNRLCLYYEDAHEVQSTRDIEPLGLVYWGGKWTIIAFCLLRNAYREFRLDRIKAVEKKEETFLFEQTKSMAHYIEIVRSAQCKQ
ncbi:hypothetical protein N473_15800 [Pseudoalteromonas luteoviolacea CPMOR-1]|uniref:HTH deoR-type domain-containing protein n=2 Tax=Pseudoalteromonas luteoviolacea TaxID=43657 RepID=A0A162AYS0_9GAMM|nr:YafY family protein [Pseudoalteromonas luteoviolacea]KID56255.1 DeoR faimly transcriptional regulator [Pseudoalteromonas luteoviolacea]KZN63780.1 hypothetical protein N473_15800 [Pseudoalteromonas luteoviolacea CPMOR-1]